MRKIQLTLLLVFLAATAVFAQRGHGDHRAGAGMEMMKELDLTAEQQEQIKLIRKDARTQMEALRKDGADRAANREAAKAIREKSKAATLAILTPAQRTQLEAKVEARKEAWKNVDKEAMKAELKAYREKTIEPVMRASRGQLDQFISAEDQTEIDRLRAVFADRPARKGKDGKGRKAGGEKGKNDQARDAQREAAAKWRTDHADDIAALDQLTQQYSKELQRAEEALAPSRKTWKTDMAEIKARYLPEGMGKKGRKGEARGRKSKRGGADKGRKDGRKGGKAGKGGNRKAAAFLLLKS